MPRLADDPRIDPRLKAAFGGVETRPTPDVPDRAVLLAAAQTAAADGQTPFGRVLAGLDHEALAPSAGLSIRSEAVDAGGHAINLQIIVPEGAGPWPCVYYIHGGGMAALSCYDPNYATWGRMIAGQGVAVAMVDFRNCLTPSSVPEVAPYPAGLDDCVAGFDRVVAQAGALGIDPARIVVAGESGGANLAVATLLRLARDGRPGAAAGLYALCPYLAGSWEGGPGSSAAENAGILMDLRSNFAAMSYGIEAFEARDPMAWPGFATAADLAGFPPAVIVVNECDPLRDDGVAFYRTLVAAGVPARCRQEMGTIHGTEVFLVCPEISRAAARDIAAFARAPRGG